MKMIDMSSCIRARNRKVIRKKIKKMYVFRIGGKECILPKRKAYSLSLISQKDGPGFRVVRGLVQRGIFCAAVRFDLLATARAQLRRRRWPPTAA